MSVKTTVKITLGDVKRRFVTVSYMNLQETTNTLFNGVCRLTAKSDGSVVDSEASFNRAKRNAQHVLELQAACVGMAPAEQTRKPGGQRGKCDGKAIEAERLRKMQEACKALLASEAAETALPASKRHTEQPDEDWDDSSSTVSSNNEEDAVPALSAYPARSSAYQPQRFAVVPTVSQKQLSRQMRVRMQKHTNRPSAASSSQARDEAGTCPPAGLAVLSRIGDKKPVVEAGKAAAVSSALVAAMSSVELEDRPVSQCESDTTSSDDESLDDCNDGCCDAGVTSHKSGESDVMRFRISASRTSRGSSVAGHTGRYPLEYEDEEEQAAFAAGMCEYCAVFHHDSCDNYADCREYVQWLILQNQMLANRVKELETGHSRSRANSLPPREKPEELICDTYDDPRLEYTDYQTHYTANPQDEYQFACYL
ncbi:hypothetical protein DIPPA_10348 [Diplonema papillatum]|nr:hypothetical protein DIPPA_10348 [Diplonema papillatum]